MRLKAIPPLADLEPRLVKTMKHVTEGELSVRESEGGFAPDDVTIDGVPLARLVGRAFGREPDARGSLGDVVLGRVRLTIEPLVQEPPEELAPR